MIFSDRGLVGEGLKYSHAKNPSIFTQPICNLSLAGFICICAFVLIPCLLKGSLLRR
jgi:hypothetical protein